MSYKRRHENIHHAFSQSLFKEYRHEPWNQVWVDSERHANWHALCKNHSPCQAVLGLLKEFGPKHRKLALDPNLDRLIEYLVDIRMRE